MITPGRDHMLFDGDCGICTRSAEIASVLDRDRGFIIIPYQFVPEEELAKYHLDYQLCSKKVQVITRRGRVYSGAFGVNYFLWHHSPWALLVAVIYIVPIFLLLEIIGYWLVARYRHRLSAWLGMTACATKR